MDILRSKKVKVSIVGGAVIIASIYGTCTIKPDQEEIENKIEEVINKEEAKDDKVVEESKDPEAKAEDAAPKVEPKEEATKSD